MDLNSLGSAYEAQAVLPLRTGDKKKDAPKASKDEGDTVSISEEAKSLLARMTAPLTGNTTSTGTAEAPSAETASAGSAEGTKAAGGAGGAGGGGSEESSASKIESLEEQIKKLQSQYQSVMKAPGDEGVKDAQGAAIQQQISALEQQLNEIKMSSLKKA